MHDDRGIHRQNTDGGEKDSPEKSQREISRIGQGHSASEHQESRLVQKLPPNFKVALIHDWLNGMRGGEIVFESLLDLFPEAHVHTLICEPQKLSPSLQGKLSRTRVFTSWMNHFSFTRNRYRQLLPLLPIAVRSLDVSDYDLVISSSHCVAKGVKKRPSAYHLSYIHAPMRYMWDRFDDYFGKGKMFFLIRWAAMVFRPLLQGWDRRTAGVERIDQLIANSKFIAEQIERCYGRTAKVIYPFAKLERFQRPRNPGNFYLMVGAFAPYKRTDLAIQAFARLGLPLKIVGSGQDELALRALKEKCSANTVEFISREEATNELIEKLYSECKAFIFPGKEDFGITPLEAMASGAPVIAYGAGGASETVTSETGILFSSQTVDSIVNAVMEVESGRARFFEHACRARAQFFTQERFQKEILQSLPLSP